MMYLSSRGAGKSPRSVLGYAPGCRNTNTANTSVWTKTRKEELQESPSNRDKTVSTTRKATTSWGGNSFKTGTTSFGRLWAEETDRLRQQKNSTLFN
eukprot:GSA120T00008987001.1